MRGSAAEMTALWERSLLQREMAELSRVTAARQLSDARGRRDRARERAGQRIIPMWRARSAAYDRFGPVTAVWVGEEEEAPDQPLRPAEDLRSVTAFAEISMALLRGDRLPEVLDLVVSHAATVLEGLDAWLAGTAPRDGQGPAPDGRRPALQLPITYNGRILAVLCVAGPDGSLPSGEERSGAQRFASRVSLMIGLAQERADREARLARTAEQLQQALDTRVVIEQAKGILSAELHISLEAAFERLRNHARSRQASVQEIAAAVVKLGLRP